MSFFADPRKYPYRAGALFLGVDAKGREVGIETDRHAVTIAGSRSGKGAALLIPNALRYPHNLLTVDPKGEVAAATWEAREALGQAVHVLDPFRVAEIPDRLRASFNPLAAIDPASRTAREDVLVIADGLVKRSDPKHEEWYAGAVSLLAGLMAFAIDTAPDNLRSFAGVRNLLLQPPDRLYATAQAMLDCHACGGLAREAGVTLMTACESEKGMEKDFLGTARRTTSWMDSPAVAEVLASSSFDLTALKSGAVTVFLVLPPQYLDPHGAFLRLFVRCGLSMMMRDGAKVNRRCLFMLDEFAALGRLDAVAKGMGLMAGYGLHLWPFVQDLGQLQDLYGREVTETFFGNSDAEIFFGLKDMTTLEYVSRRIGAVDVKEIGSPPVMGSGINTLTGATIGAIAGSSPKASTRAMGAAVGGLIGAIGAADYDARVRRDQSAMNAYQKEAMRVGRPRLSHEEIQAMSGKGGGDTVARGMFAFVKAGDVLYLSPAPYFIARPPPPTPKDETWSRQRALTLGDEAYKAISKFGGSCLLLSPVFGAAFGWWKAASMRSFRPSWEIALFHGVLGTVAGWGLTFAAVWILKKLAVRQIIEKIKKEAED